MEFLFLFLGLAGLWLGSELTIGGALNIAERHKISQLFIGLTILALGTDLPELFVTVNAALQNLRGIETSGLVIGGAIGSTLGQIAFVLGIASFFGAMTITKRELLRDGLMMLGSIVLLFVVSLDGVLSRVDGAIFIIVYLLYFATLFREEKLFEKMQRAPKLHFLWATVSIIAGLGILGVGSHLTIENALLLSEKFGVPQYILGVLAVGLATSLPELATSIAAVRKGAGSMAAGNIIGSNIFDILFTLGLGSAISAFHVPRSILFFDLPFLLVTCAVALLFFRSGKRVSRKEGGFILGVYALYFLIRVFGLVP